MDEILSMLRRRKIPAVTVDNGFLLVCIRGRVVLILACNELTQHQSEFACRWKEAGASWVCAASVEEAEDYLDRLVSDWDFVELCLGWGEEADEI